jgi:Uma2 family endonuclease
MATTANQLSWEAFEQLPDDGMHHELIERELQALPPATVRCLDATKNVFLALVGIEEQSGFRAFAHAGYELTHDPATCLQPDAFLIRAGRVAEADPDGYLLGAPELAVEVISPSESASNVERKIELFLAHGSQIVWVIYPRSRKVRVFPADGSEFQRTVGAELTLPGILDGWSLPVAPLFE